MQHKVRVRAVVLAAVVGVCGSAGPAAAGPVGAAQAGGRAPTGGLFVPGQSLGGGRLGMTKAQILRAWGAEHGLCRSCRRTTWYFNDRPFEPQGVGVAFERGRAVHLFTVWKPEGWETPNGVALGDDSARVTLAYGAMPSRTCDGYTALVRPHARSQSVFYLVENALWGFGLTRRGAPACVP